MKISRKFKGVWIPAPLWLNENLTWLQKCVIAEIESLSDPDEPCEASNEYLCQMFQVSEGRMANILSELRGLGYIESVSFDGRKRTIRVKAALTETVKAELTETVKAEVPTNITIDTSRDTPIVPQQELGMFLELPKKERLDPELIRNHKSRIGLLYNRRDSTRWSDKEESALKKLEPIPEAELQSIERYYKMRISGSTDYRRHDLATLLNNWHGELDRSRRVKENKGF